MADDNLGTRNIGDLREMALIGVRNVTELDRQFLESMLPEGEE